MNTLVAGGAGYIGSHTAKALGQARRLPVSPLWAILACALLLRILLPSAVLALRHDPSVFVARDTPDYVRPAEAMLSSGAFDGDGQPEIERTPGYPVFLMPGLIAGRLATVTVALQIFVSTLTVVLVYLTSKLLFSRKIAYWSAALYTIEPLSVIYCSQILSETLFTFLLVLFVYQTVCYLKQGKLPVLLAAALSLAAATYVRPVSYYLPIAIVLIVFYASLQKHRRLIAMTHALGFVLLYAVLVGAWQARNYRVSGYGGFSALEGFNLYFNQGSSIIAKTTGKPFYTVQEKLGYYSSAQYDNEHPDQKMWSPAQKNAFMRREGLELIKNNLLTYALIHLKGMAVVIADPGGMEYSKIFKKYPAVGGLLGTVTDAGILSALNFLRTRYPFSFYTLGCLGLMLLGYMTLAVSGAVLAWREARIAAVLLITIVVYFAVLSGGPMATGRYRHPIMPIVCIFAGYALAFTYRAALGPWWKSNRASEY